MWDEELREWRSQDEAERDSVATAVGGGAQTQTSATGEKRLSVEGQREKEPVRGNEVVWVEWDGPDDRENPFNVSCRGLSEF